MEKKSKSSYLFINLVFFITLFSGCAYIFGDTEIIDKNDIKKFHKDSYHKNETIEEANQNIYIDFSTSMLGVLKNKDNEAIFQSFLNVIDYKKATFHRLGGDSISLLKTSSEVATYDMVSEPRNFKDVYAPLEEAYNRMSNFHGISVLITDGEFYRKKDGETNYPYAREAIRNWLMLGNRIDIFVTKQPLKKKVNKLFIVFFIPQSQKANKLSDLFYDRIQKNDSLYDRVTLFSDFYTITQKYSSDAYGANPNMGLAKTMSLNEGASEKFEFYDFQNEWSDLLEWVKNGKDSLGKPLPDGDYVIRGLFINDENSVLYKIKELELNCYDVKNQFNSYLTKNKKYKDVEIKMLPNILSMDLSTYARKIKEGKEILIKFSHEFDGSQLRNAEDNLLKLDLVLKKVEINNSTLECLKWSDSKGKENVSVYNSVLNALEDATPNGKTIYTYYLHTYKYKP